MPVKRPSSPGRKPIAARSAQLVTAVKKRVRTRAKPALDRPKFSRRIIHIALAAAVAMFLLPILMIGVFRWINPPTTAFMLSAELFGESDFGEVHARHRWRSLPEIASQAPLAMIAAEDQKFPDHQGFDFEAIEDAMEHNANSKRIRGASTITQQVAKNLFLWRGRSYVRKGLEAYLTVLIEALWPKRRILEVYLNIAEFGEGVFGVEAASQQFFGTSARRLTPNQAALLAAVLPNPAIYLVNRPSAHVLWRRGWILAQMQRLGGTAYLERL
jgi:monofunctional biosynthetic peptidoglycan transglycosylase